MATKPALGFIGAGLMGHGMAKHLLLAGHDLTVMGHHNRGPVDDLVGRGAKEADTPAALAADVDMLFLSVTSSAVVRQLAEGETGFLAADRPGLIVVDTSTGDPGYTLELGEQLAEQGMHLVDAPVTRTPREAEAGQLNILLGGEADIRARVHEVVTAFCENVFEVGPLGSALKLKLINNLLSLGNAALVAEAVVATKAAGVDLKTLYEVSSCGGANSKMLEMIVPRLLAGDDSGLQFSMQNARKDLGCYRSMATANSLVSPLANAAYETYNLGVALHQGASFVSGLSGVLSDLDGGRRSD